MKKHTLNLRFLSSFFIYTLILMSVFSLAGIYDSVHELNQVIGTTFQERFIFHWLLICIIVFILGSLFFAYDTFSNVSNKPILAFVCSVFIALSVVPILNTQEKSIKDFFVKGEYADIEKRINYHNTGLVKMPKIYSQFIIDFDNLNIDKLEFYKSSEFMAKVMPVKDEKILIMSLIESTTKNEEVLAMIRDIKKDNHISVSEYNAFVEYFKTNGITQDESNQELAYIGLL